MSKTLTYIEKRIDKCFAHLIATISVNELNEFKKHIEEKYIEESELLIPLLGTNQSETLESLRQRVELLKNVLEAEEKRIKEVK